MSNSTTALFQDGNNCDPKVELCGLLSLWFRWDLCKKKLFFKEKKNVFVVSEGSQIKAHNDSEMGNNEESAAEQNRSANLVFYAED